MSDEVKVTINVSMPVNVDVWATMDEEGEVTIRKWQFSMIQMTGDPRALEEHMREDDFEELAKAIEKTAQ